MAREAMNERVAVTDAAAAMVRQLTVQHEPLMFHQSGGCCDGSAPMCYPAREFKIGQRDVLLGTFDGTPYYIGGAQFELWKHTHLTVDVVPGRGAGFSLEAPRGIRFLVRSRILEADEVSEIEAAELAVRDAAEAERA